VYRKKKSEKNLSKRLPARKNRGSEWFGFQSRQLGKKNGLKKKPFKSLNGEKTNLVFSKATTTVPVNTTAVPANTIPFPVLQLRSCFVD